MRVRRARCCGTCDGAPAANAEGDAVPYLIHESAAQVDHDADLAYRTLRYE